ncbi:hypothetical protein [Sulfurimonas sp.]|uniref:hypothetical protein n=1 Tax=Sulfurimonas sp. TaxID=2022749 RepID=UPI002608F2C6|nr:hypothetical protein [Sulfurimonas sp.]MCW8896164.1 hypothetical protein [Sulfurimonas sp.]
MKKIILFSILAISLNADLTTDDTTRFFGGYSQNEVKLIKSDTYTAPLVVTEEVFNAKSSDDIDRVVQEQQKADIASGKTAKEFLQDSSGHLFGGLSENKINLLGQ